MNLVNDFFFHLDERASAFVPESCLAVARAGDSNPLHWQISDGTIGSSSEPGISWYIA
jgi:hypothetical protein